MKISIKYFYVLIMVMSFNFTAFSMQETSSDKIFTENDLNDLSDLPYETSALIGIILFKEITFKYVAEYLFETSKAFLEEIKSFKYNNGTVEEVTLEKVMLILLRAHKYDPKNENISFFIGKIYLDKIKDVCSGINYMEKALENGHLDAKKILADIYLEKSLDCIKTNNKLALNYLEAAHKYGSNKASGILASLFLEPYYFNIKKSIEYSTLFIENAPHDTRLLLIIHLQLGQIYLKEVDYIDLDKSKSHLEKALKIDSTSIRAHELLKDIRNLEDIRKHNSITNLYSVLFNNEPNNKSNNNSKYCFKY